MAFNVYQSGGNRNNDVDKYKKANKGKDLVKQYSYQEVWDEVLNSGNILPRKLSEADRVVFVDADAIVYRVSAACESRSVLATVRGIDLEFSTRTKLKAYCEDIGEDYNYLKIKDQYINEPISACLSTLKKSVRNIYRELDATHVVFFLGGSDNFRLDLPLPTQYKAARKELHRPEYLKDCRDFLNKHYDTFIIKGLEADDVVQGVTEYVINNTPAWATAYSLDKDYHTSLTKNRYFHITDKRLVELSGGIGKLELVKNKVKGEGLHWLLFQINQGDPSDNYSPKEFFNKRFGEKSYYKTFKDYDCPKELLEAWIEKWKELLPEEICFKAWDGVEVCHDWLSLVELYMKCPYMLHNPKDETTFKSLLDKYEVDYE